MLLSIPAAGKRLLPCHAYPYHAIHRLKMQKKELTVEEARIIPLRNPLKESIVHKLLSKFHFL